MSSTKEQPVKLAAKHARKRTEATIELAQETLTELERVCTVGEFLSLGYTVDYIVADWQRLQSERSTRVAQPTKPVPVY